ncbi:hypothetical protein LNTAR_24029 [Lentisphaera araneosa HTCC2155]|uniref:GxxExxY protein n=1 Tax=Lentisphaera araneosa HTCC2155 TaxID=313628 RepID=A6DPZ4_9BACT|nr:GxxExxY protein [Lentisphaera araneosa]EDM26235.1 hypothetical protein LNTAR_24029 [Lentisphaera araneosa HTCC2155]
MSSYLGKYFSRRRKDAKFKKEEFLERNMDLEILGKEIVDSAYKVHTELGPGLLESVYEVSLAYELAKRGRKVQRQVPMKIKYEDIYFDEGFSTTLGRLESYCSDSNAA